MGRSRFARPETRTLTLSNGDTLTVKRRLNAFEGRRMRAMQAKPSLAEPGVVMAYLVDWSLPEMPIGGKSHDDLGDALDALHDDDFDEIYRAIAAHAAEMNAERRAEKNGQSDAPKSSAISPSPSAGAVPMSTSLS